MPFVWAETISKGTVLKASHVNELHDNIDLLRTTKIIDPVTGKNLPAYSWSRNPVVAETHFILAKDFTEIQSALDEAYDKNVCIADLAANDGTFNSAENAVDDASHNATINAGHDVSYLLNHYATNNSSNNSSALSANDKTVYATDNATYKNNVDNGHKSTYNGSYLTSHYDVVKGGHHNPVNNIYNATA